LSGNLDEVEAEFASHLKGLVSRDDTVLFTFGTDQADGSDANTFVHARARLATTGRDAAIERWDTWYSFRNGMLSSDELQQKFTPIIYS
jgi:hypothetical protein